ncbi:phage BR0599 family protein [Amaricoccus macauensis]|uniref:phage BR0599 family protein n=1 Tax=Amaricoccus macauensis TaxID=57001 RepID=UPI003C7D936F
MTFDTIEASVADSRPFFLYQFSQGAQVWRFTSRAADWVSQDDAGNAIPWTASAIGHGDVVQSAEIERAQLEVSFPLSDAFARRYLGLPGLAITTLTIFRGHEQLPDEVVAHWKGRVIGAEVEGARITLTCESVFSTLRRTGVRAKYQRICRHALYGSGCGLDIEAHLTTASVTALAGRDLTVPEAAGQPDGWYRAGVLRFGASHGFIVEHAGATLRLSAPMPELVEAELPAAAAIAPGCDLRMATCQAKFANLPNFGGFPAIPGRNPFGGSSII